MQIYSIFNFAVCKIYSTFAGKFIKAKPKSMEEHTMVRQRYKDLKAVHKRIIQATNSVGYIPVATIISIIQEQTAPRFYITPHTANLYINNIQHRREKSRRPEMIKDLIENYNRLKSENPDKSKDWLYEKVVEQPAKSFYMSDSRIRDIIYGYRTRKKRAAQNKE